MNSYLIGALVNLDASFTVAGVLTDPTTLVYIVREPDGIETSFLYGTDVEVVRLAQGRYRLQWRVAQSGAHYYRAEGTGAADGVQEAHFDTLTSAMII